MRRIIPRTGFRKDKFGKKAVFYIALDNSADVAKAIRRLKR